MHLTRRSFIRSTAAMFALPWLESLGGFAHAAGSKAAPQRLLLIGVPLGLYPQAFRPQQTGAAYAPSEYLSLIDDFRRQYTIISGLYHPGVNGGHNAQPRIFSGVPMSKRNSRSLDQYVAGKIGGETRYDSLVLSAGVNNFSWTDGGTMVPAQSKMANVYAKLFLDDSKSTAEKVEQQIGDGKSIMDFVQRQAKSLQPHLSQGDQGKLEEYFESVRETERRLVKSESWVHTPKPRVNVPAPQDPASPNELVTDLRNVCDMTHLAFQTDSTRVISFGYFRQDTVDDVPGLTNKHYHQLSHHGQVEDNIAQLKLIERELFKELKTFLTKLRDTKEGDSNLLERTTILITSNLGSGSSHSNRDLPVLLLGGRYSHGQHLTFEPGAPLANLYVSILNQFGIADKTFATSTGPLKGLEV
jgi:hypothetical protein